MLAPIDLPPELEDLTAETRRAADDLRLAFEARGAAAILEVGDDLMELAPDSVVRIDEGLLRLEVEGKTLRYLEDGDLARTLPSPVLPTRLVAEFATRARIFSSTDWAALMEADPGVRRVWVAHREREIELMVGLCAAHAREAVDAGMRLSRHAHGETIIEEGAESAEAFVLLHGRAHAFADGTEVGSIEENEVFGEMGLLTHSPRTATVIAATDCLVQRIAPGELERLIRGRPHLAAEMLATLARRLTAANRKMSGVGGEEEPG